MKNSMPISRLLRFPALFAFVALSAALPAGCGSTDNEDTSASGGSMAGSVGKAGATGKGGGGGSIAVPNPTVCDGQAPSAGQPCTLSAGTVCPTARGNCVCTASSWKCYEINGTGSG